MRGINDILNKEVSKKEVYDVVLGEKPLTSGNKVSQEKRLRSKCEFHTVGKGRGTKYVVTKIFEVDKPILDGRSNNKGGNNSKTAHLIENTIIYALVGKQLENGNKLSYTKLLLSKNNALETMKMVNKEYLKRYYNDFTGLENIIEEQLVQKYFMINHNRIRRRLESALNILMKKSLIHYSNVIQVKVYDDDHDQYELRKATKEELLTILEVENRTMCDILSNEEVKNINKSTLYKKGLYKKFYNMCIKELQRNGYEYIYSYCCAYEISTTQQLLLSDMKIYNVEEDIERIKLDLKRMCNYNMIENLEKTRKVMQCEFNDIAFGEVPGLDTTHIDKHIESIKMFTEMIF